MSKSVADFNAAPLNPPEASLKITEVFRSLQGESVNVGLPTVFVRLTGCPLRCHYCDTAYAFTGGERRSVQSLLEEVGGHNTHHVCVTGGEPLAQPNCLVLLQALCDAGYSVSLETSGAMKIEGVDPRVQCILDIKTPKSGEAERNLWSNIEHLKPQDQIKFVICDKADFDWAVARVLEHQLDNRCGLLFSPSCGQVAPSDLADWLLASGLQARLQLQLHKILWGDRAGV